MRYLIVIVIILLSYSAKGQSEEETKDKLNTAGQAAIEAGKDTKPDAYSNTRTPYSQLPTDGKYPIYYPGLSNEDIYRRTNDNTDNWILGGLICMAFLVAGYITVTSNRKENKKVDKKQLEFKLEHKNFITSITENFPAFLIDYSVLNEMSISMYNKAMSNNDNSSIGEFRISGELKDGKYDIVAEVMIVTQHFSKAVSAIENNKDELLFHTAALMDLLTQEREVQDSITAIMV